MSNEFYEFCATDTGTNLTDLTDYAVDSNRTSGQKPGLASAALNNRALRQANFITSNLAQLMSVKTGANILDDANSARILAQLKATLSPLQPRITKYTSGSGSHNLSYVFFIATGSATAGATYTNNAVTFTVLDTVASGLQLNASGSGAPAASGTLTKASGSGDSTITFYAVRAPLYLQVEMAGGGGGGGGNGSGSSAGTNGGNTTFGTTLLVANGGTGVAVSRTGGAGGSASLGTGPTGIAQAGGTGSDGTTFAATFSPPGAWGGFNPFGGAGAPAEGGGSAPAGGNGIANTGGGGAGASSNGSASLSSSGGGGAGGYVKALINTVLSTYAYAVGAGGTGGTAGTSGNAGGNGGSGIIVVTECYQ